MNKNMDYEKKYNEALNWMRKLYPGLHGATKEDAEHYFPELCESEDERMMRVIGFALLDVPEERFTSLGTTLKDCLSYIKKQKENPKSADSISSDCTSDAKYEDRWHKVTDSLPDNGREVLAKDKLGNTLLARYDGEGWDVSVYDDEDYRCHNGISKWCEIPSEKQKDHFRDLTKMIELQDYSDLTDLERAIHRGFLSAGVENVPVTIIKETANECKRTQTIANENANAEWNEDDESFYDSIMCEVIKEGMHPTPAQANWLKSLPERFNIQPKQEWSEEDEEIREEVISDLCVLKDWIIKYDTNWLANPALNNIDKRISWLKSLHPQPHWKPNGQQLDCLRYMINVSTVGSIDKQLVQDLYEQLQKLM